MATEIENVQGAKGTGSFERNMLHTAKGGGFLAAGSLFEFGSRFVIAFVLARLLGAGEYGIYNLAISAATIVASIGTIGLDSTMVRYIAMHKGKKDAAGLWGTLQIGVGFSFGASIVLGLSLYALSDLLAIQVFHEAGLASYLRLFSLFVPFSTLSSVLVDVARGFKRMDYSALGENVVLFVARLILVGILGLIGLNAYTAIIAFGLSDLAVVLALFYLLDKEFSFRRPLREARRDYREVLTFALPFWLSGLLTKFRKNLQTLLLGTLNTVVSVGIFSIAVKINLVGHVAYTAIITSVKPFLAELYDQGNVEQMGRLYITTTRWAFTANLPLFLLMALYPQELLSIFGESFTGGALALIVLAAGELVNAGTGICGSIIDMTGYTRLKLANSVIWVTLLSVSNVLLIPQGGVLGAAVASSFSIAFVNLLRTVEVWIIFRLQPYNWSYGRPLLAAVLASGAALLLGRVLPASGNFLFTAVHVLVLFAIYAAALLILGLPNEERTVLARTYTRSNHMRMQLQAALQERLVSRSGVR
ncbi:MAG TPA: flippase [Candidatus Binatia bacterium]|nr:flippase [Candidatus Binatia bacterium]